MQCQRKKRQFPKPIKSPSPDIVRKNIIQNTEPPLEDVRIYIQKSQSKSPRVTSHSFTYPARIQNQQEDKDNYLRNLENKLRQFENLKYKCTQLIQENVRMHSQINYLQSKVKIETNTYGQHRPTHSYKKQDNQSILKQFNQRVGRLADEKKNLNDQLQNQIHKYQSMKKDYEGVKYQNYHLRGQVYQLNNEGKSNQDRILEMDGQIYKRQLNEQMNRKFMQFQNYWEKKIRQNELKLDRITILQGLTQQKLSKNIMNTPRTYKVEPFSTQRSSVKNKIIEQGTIKSFNYDSSIRDENIRLKEQIYDLKKHIESIQSELRRKKKWEQDELNKNRSNIQMKEQNTYSPIQQIDQSFSKQRFQNTIKSLQCQLNILNKDKFSKQEQIQSLKGRLYETNKILEEKRIEFCEKNYKERNKLEDHEKQYQELLKEYQMMKKIQDLEEENVIQLKKQLLQSSRNTQNVHEELQAMINQNANLKAQYEIQLNKKQQLLNNLVKNYLNILQNIKKTLTGEEIKSLLSEIDHIFSEKVTLSSQLEIISESMDLIISELKKKILLQEDQIIQLEKKLKMSQEENNQLILQKDRLKSAIANYTLPAQGDLKNVEKVAYIHLISQQSCKLKTCLQDTTARIQQMEQQMKQLLKQ